MDDVMHEMNLKHIDANDASNLSVKFSVWYTFVTYLPTDNVFCLKLISHFINFIKFLLQNHYSHKLCNLLGSNSLLFILRRQIDKQFVPV